MEQKKVPDALRINKNRCINAIIVCALLCVLVIVAVTERLLIPPDPLDVEVGWGTYRMFTILSNMLMATAAAMCIPYTVDGMRLHDYHLPRWCVHLLYVGTNCVAVTFFVALFVLSPAAGFYNIMLRGDCLLVHLICPLLAIALFLFINSDHRVSRRISFVAVLPVILYGLVYCLMVFVIGEDAGGWPDHYQVRRIEQYLPLPVIGLILLLISFGIASLLRMAHNAIHERRKAGMERYYQQADPFNCPDIHTAIKVLAEFDRAQDQGGGLVVPRRIMHMMEKKYQSGLSDREMCREYILHFYPADTEERHDH